MVNYACGFNQSEMGKHFEWITMNYIARQVFVQFHVKKFGKMCIVQPVMN